LSGNITDCSKAGGQVGEYIVAELLKTGKHTVTAITRVGSQNKIPAGVLSKQVDYSDHASLVSALKGQDALVISLAVTAPPDTGSKLYKAAAEANVPWILPNEWGGETSDPNDPQTIFLGKIKERQEIVDLGVSSWIGIACNFWYEFSLGGTSDRFGFDMPKKSVVFYDQGETKIHTSTFPQVGRAVAAVLSLKVLPEDENDKNATLDGYRNRFVRVSSFKVSQKDMFASLLRVTNTKESDWTITYEPTKERYEKAKQAMAGGDRIAFGRMLYALGFFPGNLDFDSKGGPDNEALGLPQEDFDEWTRKGWELGNSDYFEKKYAAFAKGEGSSMRRDA